MPDNGKVSNPPAPPTEHWRELAEKASKEQDPEKLLEEVEELCHDLEQREAMLRRPKS